MLMDDYVVDLLVKEVNDCFFKYLVLGMDVYCFDKKYVKLFNGDWMLLIKLLGLWICLSLIFGFFDILLKILIFIIRFYL